MTDSPVKHSPPKKDLSTRKHKEPVPGAVLDHIKKEPPAGKRANKTMVPLKERKLGQPNRRIKSLVHELANGKTLVDAANAAGVPILESDKPGDSMLVRHATARPYVQEMIAAERAQTAADHKITRKNVLDGLKEAIDMARIMSDPAVMIAGWKEVGKMCGFYEAVKVKVDLGTGGMELSQKIIGMSDADLLRLVCGETPEDDIIDGEFTKV